MFNSGRTSFRPGIVKIKGSAADVDFLSFAIDNLLPGTKLRTRWTWSGRKPIVDINGYNEVELHNGNDFDYVNRMAGVVGVTVISVNYGSIPKDDRPRNKADISYVLTYKGRTVHFDLSTR